MSKELALKIEVKPLKVNAGSLIRSRDFSVYIENSTNAEMSFEASVDGNSPLPEGLSFSKEGVLSGTPNAKTARDMPYEIVVKVDTSTDQLTFNFSLYIFKTVTIDEIKEIRLDTWRELAENGIVPEDMQEVINRPTTKQDIYHLLQRFATFTVWNADDLRLADIGEMVEVKGISKHYNVYDFEVCLVATPKELYSHNRTLGDSLETAKAMVRDVHKRGWHVEFGGFDRMATAAWYEVRKTNATNQHQMEVRNYQPAEVKDTTPKAAPASGG